MALTKLSSGMISASASSVDLNIDAGTLYIDATNNRVGVGTTSPADNIHILGSSGTPNVGIRLQSHDTANATATLSLLARDASNVNQSVNIQNNKGNLYIDSNVGIGTNSPDRKLSIHDTANAYNLELRQTSAYDSGNQSGIVFSAIYDSSNNATDLASIRGGKENTIDGNYGGSLRFYTRENGGSDTERMRIASSGYVGIGTDSPLKPLHIQAGHSTTRAILQFDPGTSNEAQMLLWASEPGVSYNGVGIGNNIHEDGYYYGRFNDSVAYGTYMKFYNGNTYFGNTTDSRGTVGGTGTTHMQIDQSGRVITPNQPAFRAKLTTSQTITASAAVIAFNSEDFDIGNNHSNGTFTAPIAGKYAFGVNFLAYPFTTGIISLGFYQNGSLSPQFVQYGAAANSHTGITMTALLNLAASDTVDVRVYGGGLTSTAVYGGQAFWHGHLVG